MTKKNRRSMKVVAQSGYKYRETPTITLKGLWLKEIGFDIGNYVSVSCEDGKIIITPDAEKASMKEVYAKKYLSELDKKINNDQTVYTETDIKDNHMYITETLAETK